MKVNINKKVFFMFLVMMVIAFYGTVSKAATEFKFSQSSLPYKRSETLSTAYQLCYDLKNSDSTLGVNQVDPHLMLNKDWTAVTFLAESTYGNGGWSYNCTVNNLEACSSTANATGTMTVNSSDYGSTIYTSSILENANPTSEDFKNLVQNRNTRYVENVKLPITDESNRGLGFFTDTYSLKISDGDVTIKQKSNYSIGVTASSTQWGNSAMFRAAIWNIDR